MNDWNNFLEGLGLKWNSNLYTQEISKELNTLKKIKEYLKNETTKSHTSHVIEGIIKDESI